MFAEVALFISTFQSFTYKIPSNFSGTAKVGCRVKVPLSNRLVFGVITSISNDAVFKGNIKEISELIDDVPVLSDKLWKLIQWISYYYVTPIGKVFNAVLPINVSNDHLPRMDLFAKYIEVDDRGIIEKLKKNAPVQFNVYSKIENLN